MRALCVLLVCSVMMTISLPTSLLCVDLDAGCATYLKLGDTCQSRRNGVNWVANNCKRTCGLCDETPVAKEVHLVEPERPRNPDSQVDPHHFTFVVGQFHSGTSLATLSFALHPDASVVNEGGQHHSVFAPCKRERPLPSQPELLKMRNRFIAALSSVRRTKNVWDLQKQVLVEKTPCNTADGESTAAHVQLLQAMFPSPHQLTFVFPLRHPMAVTRRLRYDIYGEDRNIQHFVHATRVAIQDQLETLDALAALPSSTRVCLLRVEALVDAPEAVLPGLLPCAGLDASKYLWPRLVHGKEAAKRGMGNEHTWGYQADEADPQDSATSKFVLNPRHMWTFMGEVWDARSQDEKAKLGTLESDAARLGYSINNPRHFPNSPATSLPLHISKQNIQIFDFPANHHQRQPVLQVATAVRKNPNDI